MIYTKRVEYLFEVMGETLSAEWVHPDCLRIEETRKNGQEDTHMFGYLSSNGNAWKWEESEGGDRMFVEYYSQEFANAILDCVNDNPVPEE